MFGSNRLVAAYGLYYVDHGPTLLRVVDPSGAEHAPRAAAQVVERARRDRFNAVAGNERLKEQVEAAGLLFCEPTELTAAGFTCELGGPDSGPFAGSLAALHNHRFATEERPLTMVARVTRRGTSPRPTSGSGQIGTLHQLAGAVAHGVRGYVVPMDVLGESAEELARFQSFLANHEEEITASAEVQDPIAWLDYQPYGATGGWGLHALLLTCGYNPVVVDLERIDDEALTEYRLAIFPSQDFLDVDAYGKLVVFALHGGHLVTSPAVPERQLDGSAFRSNFLWHHLPAPRGAAGGGFGRLLKAFDARNTRLDWAGPPLRVNGEIAAFPTAERPVVRYGTTSRRAERSGGPTPVQSEVLLRHKGMPAAYRSQVRDGVSTLIGAEIGLPYVSNTYGGTDPRVRLGLRRFAVSLLEDQVPRQIVPDDTLEVEATARLSPDGGCLLFVINRIGRQFGALRFPSPEALNLGPERSAMTLFSANGSHVEVSSDGITLDIAPGDVLVVRLR